MSTNSTISILNNDDGTVTSIYCHWDGYIAHNGRILHDNYNDEESVRSLLSLGSLSCLGENLDECVAYGRDNGENENDVKAMSFEDWTDMLGSFDQDYNYLFVPNEGWRVQYDDGKEDLLANVLQSAT